MEKTKTKDEIIANKEKVVEFSIEGLRFRVEMDYTGEKPKGKVSYVRRERPIPEPLYPCDVQWLPVCNFAYKPEELFWFDGKWSCKRCVQATIKEKGLDITFTEWYPSRDECLDFYMKQTRLP